MRRERALKVVLVRSGVAVYGWRLSADRLFASG